MQSKKLDRIPFVLSKSIGQLLSIRRTLLIQHYQYILPWCQRNFSSCPDDFEHFGHLWIIHSLLLVLQTIYFQGSFYDTFSGSNNNFIFLWIVHTHTTCILALSARTHHFGLRLQNFENPKSTVGFCSLNALKSSLGYARWVFSADEYYVLY